MKEKVIILVLMLVFVFSGCTRNGGNIPDTTEPQDITETQTQDNKELFKGAWISYFELTRKGRSEKEYENYLRSLFINMNEVSVTDVFLHVRAFGDAAYASALFPPASFICEGENELPFDVLSMALSLGKEYGMDIHAWINPYRAMRGNDTGSIPVCQMKTWIENETQDVVSVNGRYYFNPSSDKAAKLIVDGVREILTSYPDVKGIHIDDYFYPENCGNFDSEDYEKYLSGGGKLSLYDYRRENVNNLVSTLYSAVKSFGEDKIFSVSPSADIDKCYGTLYADVKLWAGNDGYCDLIMPQVYFGFHNESMPFIKTVDLWYEITKNSSERLVIGLALYKCGETDKYAGKGINEWTQNSDIIKRQVEYIKEQNIYGFSLYSSSFINFSESFLSKEANNLKSVL